MAVALPSKDPVTLMMLMEVEPWSGISGLTLGKSNKNSSPGFEDLFLLPLNSWHSASQ